MTPFEELSLLIGKYLTANPESKNPINNLYLTGTIGLINLLKKADNKPIEWVFDENRPDWFEAKIDGNVIDFKM